ncbi:DUF192 domain-containing protein [Candidatus Woesearchaeota archaeon]|nr:DUF192 domain-containing protein [Candidatus Woesearchaeota archaeon]
MVSRIRVVSSFFLKAKGLMFSPELHDECLIFFFAKETKVPIHMMFVFFPIDVLWLNAEKRIVAMKENLRPFRYYDPKVKAQYVVELPQGTIKKHKLVFGNTLRVKRKSATAGQ